MDEDNVPLYGSLDVQEEYEMQFSENHYEDLLDDFEMDSSLIPCEQGLVFKLSQKYQCKNANEIVLSCSNGLVKDYRERERVYSYNYIRCKLTNDR